MLYIAGLEYFYMYNSPESQHLVPESSQSGRSSQSFPPLTVVSLISPHLPAIGKKLNSNLGVYVFLSFSMPLIAITILLSLYELMRSLIDPSILLAKS